MKIQTFRGPSMADTLELVKRRFGPDAVIIGTRTVESGGLLGFGARHRVEITAAAADLDLPEPLRSGTLPVQGRKDQKAEGVADLVVSPANHAGPRRPDPLLAELGELKTLVGVLVRDARDARLAESGAALYDAYQKLVQNAVADELARQLVEKVRAALSAHELGDPATVRRRLAQTVRAMLPVACPICLVRSGAPTVVALVGPTGVGKTTTVAKLAADFSLRQRRRVGLITIDTYRIAAVEQLRTYARIINVPLEVVMSPPELSEAVRRLNDCHVVLIDTAGRSQRDEVKIQELGEFFRAAPPDEVHLVLSGTGAPPVLQEAIRRFAPLGVSRVIFSKLDETVGFGVLLSCLASADAQLSYVTTGQSVPDDIRVGDRDALTRLILGPCAGPDTDA